MDKTIKQKCIDALRKTKTKQSFGYFYDSRNESFCALGVIGVEVLGLKAEDRLWASKILDGLGGQEGLETYKSIREWNDYDKLSFKQIARKLQKLDF